MVVAEFAYDALGRRIEKKDLLDSNNTTRYYYNNNWRLLCEYDGADSFERLFVYGNCTVYTDDGNDDTWLTDDDTWLTDDDTTAICSAKGNPYLFTGRRVDILEDGGLELVY